MNQQLKYNVDIVLCIDSTGSMGPVINEVKANALRFYQDLKNNMTDKGKAIDHLRVRVVEFRDFYADGRMAFNNPSKFFTLPGESANFSARVSGIFADGGGDEPENGLEALAFAIQSPWNDEGDKKRQVIVIWTDASAHPLEKNLGTKPPNYLPDMPKNLDELTDLWESDKFKNFASSKRLIIYSPDKYPWTEIANNWTNIIHVASQAGYGLSDIEYDTIIDTIANSI